MTTVAVQDSQLTEFAERVYIEQKEEFIKDLVQHLKARIESGQAQFKNGEYMSLESSKDLINQELFNSMS